MTETEAHDSLLGLPAVRPKHAATFLRRITKALRQQNWVAVGIELLIVVVGVVIGFQVTAWTGPDPADVPPTVMDTLVVHLISETPA